MGTTKTLGGDRLGAGKKMKVELHGYERSTHDLSYIWRSTMAAGTLVPFMSEVALPGDTFDIDLQCEVLTHPTIGPLFGSFKVQLDIFEAPIRLYNSALHNNALNIGRNMSMVKLPQITLINTNVDEAEDLDNSQINPSCILAYLGIRGVGTGAGGTNRKFNAVPYLAYWEIYKNYYANKQEEIGAVIRTENVAISADVTTITADGSTIAESPALTLVQLEQATVILVNYTPDPPPTNQILVKLQYNGWKTIQELCTIVNDNGTQLLCQYNAQKWGTDYAIQWRMVNATDLRKVPPAVHTFTLSNIDDMRQEILTSPGNTEFNLSGIPLEPYSWAIEVTNDIPNALNTQEGLAIKTYQSDLFNNWLSTEWIDGAGGITEISAIAVVDDVITIDQINLSRKVYDMLNRIAVSGGTYNDWVEVMYDHKPMVIAESPMYCGGLSKELVFQEVISQSNTEGLEPKPLGTLAGRGKLSSKHKGGKIVVKVNEPSYLMGIISLTPRIDYSQGNKWDVHLQTMDDLHKPALDEIGFQELIMEQMAWWDTRYAGGVWVQRSAGKQPAWINYMTNTNVTRGNFAIQDDEMFMTLNRRYEYGETGIADMTTYIDPKKFNFIFAETSIDAQNFWVQIGVNITARRKMSAKLMPNL